MTKNEREFDEQVLGLLAESLPAISPSSSLRSTLTEQLEGALRFAPFEPEIVAAFGISPEILREAFARLDDPTAWQPAYWPGSRVVWTSALALHQTVLARLDAGTRIASHGHSARELTYVLSGELAEDLGRTLRAGDLLVAESGCEHALRVVGDEPCLVVFAMPK